MAPVTEQRGEAVIVAHGFPSDPEPQDQRMKSLAAAVARLRKGWRIRGATLAMPGSLEVALAGLHAPLVYPFFMAEGYFTRHILPRRLAQYAPGARLLQPFGAAPAVAELATRCALEGAGSFGLSPGDTTLLIAAHGSKLSSSSKDTVMALARMMRETAAFRKVKVGLIEEEPFLAIAARGLGPALCLPFFALRAGHVEDDVPRALTEAGFDGPLLAPLGEHAQVPQIIADAMAHATERAAA